ncbi:class I SAM-dependent methyltransferase [Aquibium carbonis]|uniref:Class I SAM-dependent methyltransferase n=1 Tax=Aquibium carbonis TaxID=2495581 RepID=A0A429YSI8_9HYPH|nr:class I SAM-dependent methyltransferase [Aquibium carbonis]RST84429.1 class I SAM-dependent methyltransferase [Aquibium carbonis]
MKSYSWQSSVPPPAQPPRDVIEVTPTLIDPASTTLAAHGRTFEIAGTGDEAALAFQFTFIAGARHRVTLELSTGTAASFRLEVHGRVTKMQKAVATVAADGSILSVSEEIRDLSVSPLSDGRLAISFAFEPFRTRLEYLYVFAKGATNSESDRCAFKTAPALFEVWPSPEVFRSMEHSSASKLGDVVCAIQECVVIENFIKVEFEIHKPGTALRALGVRHRSMALAKVQWWSWPLGGRAPAPGRDDAYCWPAARKPSSPIMAPALVDRYGPAFVHDGHAVTMLLDDLPDYQSRPVEEVGQLGDVFLKAVFEDGSTHDIDIAALLQEGGDDEWLAIVNRFIADRIVSAGADPVFLEVGARGAISASIRNWTRSLGWRYAGLDIASSPNVDIVGDAHQLSRHIAEDSVDVVYSSEVLEHLVSPVSFVTQANRVLKQGGLFICRAPTTWPLHAEPWDFCRFSRHSWQGLLHPESGFEILGTCEFGKASVLPRRLGGASGALMSCHPAPLLSGVVARKIRSIGPLGSAASSPVLAMGQYDAA